MPVSTESPIAHLDRSLVAVGELISTIRPEQWSAPTPCDDWDVGRVVSHMYGMNLVFAAMLTDQPPPRRGDVPAMEDLAGLYRDSAAALLAAFNQPDILERTLASPMGSATGLDRLHIRLYDLLAHGWDVAQATGQPARLPDDLAEQSLAFARRQLQDQVRGERFGLAQPVPEDASALDRLAAFLGRPVPWRGRS